MQRKTDEVSYGLAFNYCRYYLLMLVRLPCREHFNRGFPVLVTTVESPSEDSMFHLQSGESPYYAKAVAEKPKYVTYDDNTLITPSTGSLNLNLAAILRRSLHIS